MTRGGALLAWYGESARDLPWRRTTDPYRILVSEVMLQQTQAERVVAHYERFVERFPTVEALAAATLSEVLQVWSGLGYNRRAQRLREAARRIAADGWPTTPEDLQTLPGVGPYTAAAVAAFAFGVDVAVVDTNVRRVLSRWVGRPLQGTDLHRTADEVKEGNAATWNQAVMELGATVCRPRAPRCDECPVAAWCADPGVYAPPPRQAPFVGSRRQVRGAVLRSLGDEWMDLDVFAAAAGHDRSAVDEAVAALHDDGLLDRRGRWIRIAD